MLVFDWYVYFFFFFFSSRRRHTRYIGDWSSDVCSSDLPYPHKFQVTVDLRQFLKDYEKLQKGEQSRDIEVRIAGRIYTKRVAGSKLVFYDIRAEGVKVQVACQAQEAMGDVSFEAQHEHLRQGGIIGIIG